MAKVRVLFRTTLACIGVFAAFAKISVAIESKSPPCAISYVKKNNLYVEVWVGENVDFRLVTSQFNAYNGKVYLRKDWLYPMTSAEPGIPSEAITTGVTQISEQTFLKDDSMYWLHPSPYANTEARYVYDYIMNGVTGLSGRSFLKNSDLYRLRLKNNRLENYYVASDVQTVAGTTFLRGDALYKVRETDYGVYTDYLTSDFTQFGNGFILRGADLYLVTQSQSGYQFTWVTNGVSFATDRAFLKKDALYMYKRGTNNLPLFDYVTNGVNTVSGLCDPL